MSSRPIKHCYWVVPGKLLAGEYPGNIDDGSSRAKLALHGHTGSGALVRLNELWQECPRSRYWDSPETWEQAQYVRGWEGDR